MHSHRSLFSFSSDLGLMQKTFLASLIASFGLGKWGAWIGLPNFGIFLIDVLYLGSLVGFSLTNRNQNRFSRKISAVVFVFTVVQYCRSSEMTLIAVIRDLLPFIYLAFVPLIVDMIRSLNLKNLISSMRIGVIVSLIWTIPVTAGAIGPLAVFPSFFGVPIFTHRFDLTGIILAIGIIVFGEFENCELRASKFLIAICVILGMLQSSRAATIAVLLAVIYSFSRSSTYAKSRIFILAPIIGGILICIMVISPSLIEPLLNKSSLTRFGLIGNDTLASIGASHTSEARIRAAGKLLSWFDGRHEKLLGVGPGTEMVQLSGAVTDLSGSLEVRAPHNWFIGLFVRYGYFGTLIWLLIVLGGFFRSHNQDLLPWKTLVIILCVVASMGVIVESPFGSLPLSFLVSLTYAYRKV
jgi:hypothetical protein